MPNLTGQFIGRYHILEQLGEGGMATVYKAYDTRLERNVAFKVLRADLFGQAVLDQVLKRFEREAKSLAKLSHPNIVNILDYGEHDTTPYLVMEYVPGGTLKQQLGKQIPWQEALEIILPVAQGLSYAHEHNVIHRDIKPANILMKEGDLPVLTDFGIAKLLEGADDHTLTASGVGIGTPEYMAPEQGIGASTIDARADIYSLGIVLYEMVTGRKPYIADTPMAVVLKQMTDPLPRPSDFVPDLPEEVEQILLKALAKEPDDRYTGMDSLIGALETTLVKLNQQEISEKDIHYQEKKLGDSSNLLTKDVKPKKIKQPAQFTKNFVKFFKLLFIIIVVAGLGTGGYFAWQRWGVSNSQMIGSDGRIEKVCFIYTPRDIRSYGNTSIWQGILDATHTINVLSESYQTEKSEEEIQGTLDTMYKENCDLIIGNGDWLKEQFLKSAKENPTIFFLPVDVSYTEIPRPLPDNLIEQTYSVYDGAYLAGYLAAGSTQTGKVGTFGAEKTETVMEFMDGFVEGVQRYNADFDTQIEIIGWDPISHTGLLVGDFNNYEAHTLHANDLIQDQVDIIFIASTLEAVRDAINRASEVENLEVRIIGVDQDWKSYLTAISLGTDSHPDVILGSVKKYDERMVTKAITQLQSGTYDGSRVLGNLNNGGIDLIYYDEDVDSQLRADLQHLWEEISGVSKGSNLPVATKALTSETALPPSVKPEVGNPILEADLSYISENPPTFEDDFSTTKSGWGSNSEGMAIFDHIKNGYLNVRDGVDPNHDGSFSPDFKVPGVTFPINGLFDASDFALQFWFQFGDTKSINLQLRSAETIDTGYRFTLEQSGHWELESSEDATLLAKGNQAISTEYNKALVIANDNNLAIFINDKPIYVSDGVSTSRTNNRIIVIGNVDGARCIFDDFKFWNLDGVNIPDSGTPTSSASDPTWVADFAEPILSAISRQTPDFQDDFSTNFAGWTNGDNMADWRIDFVDGEMVVTDSPVERNMLFTDFVIEMDARFLAGDSSNSNMEWRFHYRQPGVNYFFDFEYNSDVEVGYEQLNTPSEYIRLENVLGPVTITYHILIIVKDQAVALFINDEPIYYDILKPVWKTGEMEWSVDGTVAFDNFKIWDIRNLEIP